MNYFPKTGVSVKTYMRKNQKQEQNDIHHNGFFDYVSTSRLSVISVKKIYIIICSYFYNLTLLCSSSYI